MILEKDAFHLSHQVYQCVKRPPEDLLREDDRHLATVQPDNPLCRGDFFSYVASLLAKVLLQTYIEYLRGLVEDKKTINHHGREVEVDLDLMTEKPLQVKPAITQVFDLE